MNFYWAKAKTMERYGFKGNSIFTDAKSHSLYYKKFPACRCVLVVANYNIPQSIQVFRLTPRDYRSFRRGNLSLVPVGCCHPTPGRFLNSPDVLWEGDFKDWRHVVSLVQEYEQKILKEAQQKSCKTKKRK